MRALLVDDSPLVRTLLTRRLRAFGAVVTTAASVAEAQRQIAAGDFDIAVLDLELDDGSGLAVAALLDSTSARTRYVFFSGTPSGPLVDAARERSLVFEKSGEFEALDLWLEQVAKVFD
jgi:DNA-binding response OmpR family regulator